MLSSKRLLLLSGRNPSLDLNFRAGAFDGRLISTRASVASDSLYTDAAGSGFNQFAVNVPRIVPALGGLLLEDSRQNFLLNPAAPVSQTTQTLFPGAYVLWPIGSGSATSSAGTATGSGFGVATAGVPNFFTVTVAGTVVVTGAGSINRFQLEAGLYPTSFIPGGAVPVTRARDSVTMPIGPWFNPVAGTLVTEAIWLGVNSTSFPRLVQFDDGTNNNSIDHVLNVSANNVYCTGLVAGAAQWNITTTAFAIGTLFKQASSWQANSIDYALNGALYAHDGLATIPAGLTTLRIGSDSGGSVLQTLVVQRVRYYPFPSPRAFLAQVTT